MTEQPDYDDDWGPEEPSEPDTLAELVTRLADYAGLTIAHETPAAAHGRPVAVSVTCNGCGVSTLNAVTVRPGESLTIPNAHLCGADLGDGKHLLFSFTITAGG